MKKSIKFTNLVHVSVSSLTKLYANNLTHDTRTRYILLNLTANLETKVA